MRTCQAAGSRGLFAAVLVGAVGLLGACDRGGADTGGAVGGEDAAVARAADASAASAREVIVRARDFAFDAPDTIEAGVVRFRVVNDGPDFHHVQLVRLDEGRTFQELMAALSSGDHDPSFAHWVGGPNAPVPGEHATATVELEPGSYAMLCLIPSSDGLPHVTRGMAAPLTVVAASQPSRLPRPDVVMSLTDYDFSTDVALTPGRHVIKVHNPASQPHELILVQLAPGRTVDDIVAWLMRPAGPPPGKPVGGVTAIGPGEENYMTVDLSEGDYALLCMVPDAADGRPHIAHGMAKQIAVGI